jgi:tryptophan halogenase
MRVGIHERIFVKNVCAIGLSAGFIEPLESNGLLSVHEFLKYLIKILKRGVVSQWDKDNFNFTCKTFFDEFAEFVSFHYCLSSRTDSKYWRDIKNRSYFNKRKGDSMLKKNIECFMDSNNFFRSDAGTHYIATGMNYFGIDVFNNIDRLKEIIEKRKKESKKWNDICKSKDSLLDFLRKYIHKK